MVKKRQSSSTTRKILFLTLPALVLAGVILYFSAQNFSDQETCGCPNLEKNATGEFDPGAKIAYWQNKPLDLDFQELKPSGESLALQRGAVLGANTDERWIEIDLSDQKLYAHEGDRIVYDFLISSGKWGRTPTGSFRVWGKFKYTKMSGGSRELHTYYYLPNVPYVMYFHDGVGTHGTYWHQNFGTPMSHGCVNMATPEAEKLFYWAGPVLADGQNAVRASKNNPGTKVVVHD